MIGDQHLTISVSKAEQLLDLYNKSNKKDKNKLVLSLRNTKKTPWKYKQNLCWGATDISGDCKVLNWQWSWLKKKI